MKDPPRDAIESQLARILASPVFSRAERMSRFLRLIVEKNLAGEGADLKEYNIGIDVFDKDESFDPRIDPAVRSEARRLRSKLSEYYRSAGARDAILIELPKGTYNPVFTERQTGADQRRGPVVLNRRWGAAAGIAIAIALLGLGAWRVFGHRAGRGGFRSVAVLPFENFSSDRDNEYFSDGLTEEILNALTNVPGLKVAARTSAFKFKGRHEDVRAIGRILNVETVLEGSVRRDGNHVRITPQLISTADGYHLWSAEYDREARDIFGVQREIASAIARNFGAKLAAAPAHSPDPEAYNLYLQARYHFNKFDGGDMRRSIELTKQAIARDGGYAPAYANLSDAYGLLGALGYDSGAADETRAKAKAAALKAIELDPNLAEAWATLAAHLAEEFDWSGAEGAFRKGLEVGPGCFEAHAWYAELYLTPKGRLEEAIRESETAAGIDPISPYALERVAHRRLLHGDYDEALLWARKAVDLEPRFWLAYPDLVTAHLAKHDIAGARALIERARALFPSSPLVVLQTIKADAAEAKTAEALKALGDVGPSLKSGSYCEVAAIHQALGRAEEATSWLERAVEVRSGCFEDIPADPRFDELHPTPRFQALLQRMRLPVTHQ